MLLTLMLVDPLYLLTGLCTYYIHDRHDIQRTAFVPTVMYVIRNSYRYLFVLGMENTFIGFGTKHFCTLCRVASREGPTYSHKGTTTEHSGGFLEDDMGESMWLYCDALSVGRRWTGIQYDSNFLLLYKREILFCMPLFIFIFCVGE